MQTSLPKQVVRCIGKCILGLTTEELDLITDNVNNTLQDSRGRQIFKKYLEQNDFQDNLECLDLYEACYTFFEKHQSSELKSMTLETLIDDAIMIKEMAEDLDGVSQIDFDLLKRFNDALNSECKYNIYDVIEDTKECTRDHLSRIHEGFKKYASEPCPRTK